MGDVIENSDKKKKKKRMETVGDLVVSLTRRGSHRFDSAHFAYAPLNQKWTLPEK
jgi:hypothetical protein